MLRLLVTNVTQGNVIILLNKIDKKLILGYYYIQIILFENNRGIPDFVLRNFLDDRL